MFLDYAHIAKLFSGWNLTELRKMTVRERHYWTEVVAQSLGLTKRETEHG